MLEGFINTYILYPYLICKVRAGYDHHDASVGVIFPLSDFITVTNV